MRLPIVDFKSNGRRIVELQCGTGFKLGLIGVNRQDGQEKRSEKLGLNWVCLGLFSAQVG